MKFLTDPKDIDSLPIDDMYIIGNADGTDIIGADRAKKLAEEG